MKFQKELDNFALKTKVFCNWVESKFTEPDEEMRKAEVLLAELHLAILLLPKVNSVWEEIEDLEEIENQSDLEKQLWEKARNKLSDLSIKSYWEIFDSSNSEEKEPVYALLSDDLADIYSDLKRGLMIYEQEKLPEAFWEWKFNFEIHWENHLTSAQKVIRDYLWKLDSTF